MRRVLHLNILLRLASNTVLVKKRAITALENIDIRVVERGVSLHIQLPITTAKMKSPEKTCE
jgi:hypothetical protein